MSSEQDGIRVSVSISRKINLGNYESADAFVSLSNIPVGATQEEIEEALATGRLVWDALKPELVAKARELREGGRGTAGQAARRG